MRNNLYYTMEDQENNNTINEIGTNERKQHYRELLNQVNEIHESNDFGLQTIKKVDGIMTEINLLKDQYDLGELVKYPEEILLDSLVLSSASDALLKCTMAVDILASNYEPLEFASKIADTIKSGETVQTMDFLKLLEDARDIIPNSIGFSFLYGTYDVSKLPEPKEKKVRVREAQEHVQKKELVNVQNTQNNDEADQDIIMFFLEVLKKEYKANNEKPLQYYDFVVDSNNYGTTVENMFYFSFLLRDGRAMLDIENKTPIVRPTTKKELKSFRHTNGVNTQIVISIDMDEWDRLRSSKEGYLQRNKRNFQR